MPKTVYHTSAESQGRGTCHLRFLKVGYLPKLIIDIPDAAGYAVFSESACADWHFGCKLRAACGMFSTSPALSCFLRIVIPFAPGSSSRALFFCAACAPSGLDVCAGMW